MITKNEDELALDLLPCHRERYEEIRRLRREIDPSGKTCIKFRAKDGEIVSYRKGYVMPSVPPVPPVFFEKNEENSL